MAASTRAFMASNPARLSGTFATSGSSMYRNCASLRPGRRVGRQAGREGPHKVGLALGLAFLDAQDLERGGGCLGGITAAHRPPGVQGKNQDGALDGIGGRQSDLPVFELLVVFLRIFIGE